MKKIHTYLATTLGIGMLVGISYTATSADDDPIEYAMKKYNKAPKGTDHISKRASEGKATKEEIAGMLKAYTAMAAAKPPVGDAKSWKEKNAALLAATTALRDGKPGAQEAFKEASNCKACHSEHKPKK